MNACKALLPLILLSALIGCSTTAATRPAAAPAPAEDFLVRQLNHEDARFLATLLPRFLNVQARALPKTNCIVVTGHSGDLKLADYIISTLDKSSGPEDIVSFIYPLKRATADQAASTLQEILDHAYNYASDGGPRFIAIPDARSNSLFVLTLPHDLDAIRKMIDELDTELPRPPKAPAIIPAEP